MPENILLELELKNLCENISQTHNTCSLYSLQNLIDSELLDEKQIKSRHLIIECLNKLNNIIPSKLLENLLKKSIELDDVDICYSIINNVQLLEENHAVDCLRYFIKDESKQIEKQLNTLFLKKFDYRLLTGELKRVSSDQFIICLQYLQNHLKSAFQNQQISTTSVDDSNIKMQLNSDQETENVPTLIQIVDLFSCFVDAHFTHITLAIKAQEVIADVLQLIETQLDLFMDLISIDSLIKEAKHNSEFRIKNNNNNIGHYYIEVLKLV